MTDLAALTDLCTPWCMHVVATLRIADHLAAGTTRIDELAAAVGADADALGRVLRHLVTAGVFEEPAPGDFALNDPARALLESGVRLGLDLDGIGGRMAHAWATLLPAVRTGAPAYHQVFGRPFWEDLQANPGVAATFDALMGPEGHGTPDPEVLVDGDWDAVLTVVDVGGGTGALLLAILAARSGVRGTLVDLPATIERARERFQAAGVTYRATTAGQSFFDPLPAGADLYVLKNVLADWPDREAVILLRRCAEAADPAGRVTVIGGVSPDESRGADPALLMLVLVGGRERTLSEFREMADAAGLLVHAIGRQPSGRFVVECGRHAIAGSTTTPDATRRLQATSCGLQACRAFQAIRQPACRPTGDEATDPAPVRPEGQTGLQPAVCRPTPYCRIKAGSRACADVRASAHR